MKFIVIWMASVLTDGAVGVVIQTEFIQQQQVLLALASNMNVFFR